jgi:predicted ATPase
MKLAKIALENFRQFGTSSRPMEIPFTDPLGRVRDFTLLVGPNASGKTTILDAIGAALTPSLEMPATRREFKLSPRTVVRRGARNARVTCWLRFTPQEVETTRELFRLAEIDEQVPNVSEVALTWEYPDPRGWSDFGSTSTARKWSGAFGPVGPPRSDFGYTHCNPPLGWTLLKGRVQAARLLATGLVDWSWFQRVGCAFTFDQERTGLGKTISRQVWNIIHGVDHKHEGREQPRTTDPRTILIDLALRSLVHSEAPLAGGPREFERIQERFARICEPRRIVGAVEDALGEFDIHFNDGRQEYQYEGLSSGEKMTLLLLIRFVAEHMHRSIVMIDEMELNQHPIWQRKLLHAIPQMGDDNQIIATTHSPYLRDAVRPDAVIDLGDLGDHDHEEPV